MVGCCLGIGEVANVVRYLMLSVVVAMCRFGVAVVSCCVLVIKRNCCCCLLLLLLIGVVVPCLLCVACCVVCHCR